MYTGGVGVHSEDHQRIGLLHIRRVGFTFGISEMGYYVLVEYSSNKIEGLLYIKRMVIHR